MRTLCCASTVNTVVDLVFCRVLSAADTPALFCQEALVRRLTIEGLVRSVVIVIVLPLAKLVIEQVDVVRDVAVIEQLGKTPGHPRGAIAPLSRSSGVSGDAAQANEALLTRSVDGRRQRILTSIVPNDNQIYRVMAESDYLQRKPRRPLVSS